MAGQEAYTYISLRQAQDLAARPALPVNCYKNIFAVVTECTSPRPTRGTGVHTSYLVFWSLMQVLLADLLTEQTGSTT